MTKTIEDETIDTVVSRATAAELVDWLSAIAPCGYDWEWSYDFKHVPSTSDLVDAIQSELMRRFPSEDASRQAAESLQAKLTEAYEQLKKMRKRKKANG